MNDLANDPAAQPVLEALRMRKWRKARDLAKGICKRDRVRYQPLLVEANAGLFREMLAKGLVKEAETVLGNLRAFASPELCETLQKELSAPVAPRTEARGAGDGDSILSHWGIVLGTAESLAAGRAVPEAAWISVDAAVACFVPAPPGAEGSHAARVGEELELVHAACEATSDGHWDEARAALQKISAGSVFRNWRLFLRGVRHWFLDEHEPARRCFAALPEAGACARAAEVIAGDIALAAPAGLSRMSRVSWGLAVSGEPVEWTQAITDADAAWRSGDWRKACVSLNRGLGGIFPCDNPGLNSLLTDLIFPSRPPGNDLEVRRLAAMMTFWADVINRPSPPQNLLGIMRRSLVLMDEHNLANRDLRSQWGKVIAFQHQVHGDNARRDAMAWLWLGERLAEADAMADFLPLRTSPAIRDPSGAKEAFEKAVERDPENERAWMALLSLVDQTGKSSERNKLLDLLGVRFPKNKEVLFKAGTLALKRKALGKGLAYLRGAYALDPLDIQVRLALVAGLIHQAREASRKGKPSEGIWREIEPLLSDRLDSKSFMLDRWAMRVRRSLLESDPEKAAEAHDEARRLASSAPERLYLEMLLRLAYRLPEPREWQEEWDRIPPISFEELAGIVFLISYASQMPESAKVCERASDCLFKALRASLADEVFTRDPRNVWLFTNFCRAELLKSTDNFQGIGIRCLNDVNAAAQGLVSRQPKCDPYFRLISLYHLAEIPGFRPADTLMREIDRFIADVSEPQHAEVLAFAQDLRTMVADIIASAPARDSWIDEVLGDDDENEKDDDDFDDEPPPNPPTAKPARNAKKMINSKFQSEMDLFG